jgi:hypothetical protein
MEQKTLKTINVYFFSSRMRDSGISSLIYRMLYNNFIENIPKKEIQYQYKLFTGKKYFAFNIWKNQKKFDSLNFKDENIFLYVFNLDEDDPNLVVDPLFEEAKFSLKDNYKNVKIGLIANKIDLVNQSDIENILIRAKEYSKKRNSKLLFSSAKEGKGNLFQFIIEILNYKSKKELIKSKKSLSKKYAQFYKSKNLNNIHRCEICKTKILEAKFHENLNIIEFNCKENHNKNFNLLYTDKALNKKCDICFKEVEEKNSDSFDFCKICQILICPKCDHIHKSEGNIIRPYYCEDQLCENHGLKNNICCLTCKSLICSLCHNINHRVHNVDNVDHHFINQKIEEKKILIKKIEEQMELFNKFYLNLI